MLKFSVKITVNLRNTLNIRLLSIYREKCMLSSSLFINLPKPLPENPLRFLNNGFNRAKKTYHNHVFYSRDFDISSYVQHFS